MNKRLVLIENSKGHFNIGNFGAHIAGARGEKLFDVIVQSEARSVDLVISSVSLAEVFMKLDPTRDHYTEGIYSETKFIKVSDGEYCKVLSVRKQFFQLVTAAAEDGRLVSKTSIVFQCSELGKRLPVLPEDLKKMFGLMKKVA